MSSCQFFWIVTVSPSGQPACHLALEIADQSAREFQTVRMRGSLPRERSSDPPPLARTATIVRDRRHVSDRSDGEARSLQRAERRLAARTGTRDLDFQRAHAVF